MCSRPKWTQVSYCGKEESCDDLVDVIDAVHFNGGCRWRHDADVGAGRFAGVEQTSKSVLESRKVLLQDDQAGGDDQLDAKSCRRSLRSGWMTRLNFHHSLMRLISKAPICDLLYRARVVAKESWILPSVSRRPPWFAPWRLWWRWRRWRWIPTCSTSDRRRWYCRRPHDWWDWIRFLARG